MPVGRGCSSAVAGCVAPRSPRLSSRRAEAIPGAELVVIDGMGHDLPRPLWPTVAERLAALVARAQQRPGSNEHLGELDVEASRWAHGPSVLLPRPCRRTFAPIPAPVEAPPTGPDECCWRVGNRDVRCVVNPLPCNVSPALAR